MIRILQLTLACIFLIFHPLAQPSETELSGFASIVGGKVFSNDRDFYTADPTVEMGIYDSDIQFNPETLLGIRLAFEVNNLVELTAQVVAKGGDDFQAVFDWAYVNYQFSDHSKAIFGRYRLPLYYYSDYLDTAYAYPWIRPPTEVYYATATSLTGINFIDVRDIAEFMITSQVWFGSDNIERFGEKLQVENDRGINSTIDFGVAQLRAVYNLKDIYSINTDTTNSLKYYGLGLMMDLHYVHLRSELSKLDVEPTEVNTDSGYLSLEHRIGEWLPYIIFSRNKSTVATNETKNNNISIGTRWDFAPRAACKIEISRISSKFPDSQNNEIIKHDFEMLATSIDIFF